MAKASSLQHRTGSLFGDKSRFERRRANLGIPFEKLNEARQILDKIGDDQTKLHANGESESGGQESARAHWREAEALMVSMGLVSPARDLKSSQAQAELLMMESYSKISRKQFKLKDAITEHVERLQTVLKVYPSEKWHNETLLVVQYRVAALLEHVRETPGAQSEVLQHDAETARYLEQWIYAGEDQEIKEDVRRHTLQRKELTCFQRVRERQILVESQQNRSNRSGKSFLGLNLGKGT